MIFLGVARVLTFEIYLVPFYIRIEHIIGAHPQHLRHADQKVEQIHHLDPGILLVSGSWSGFSMAGMFCKSDARDTEKPRRRVNPPEPASAVSAMAF